MTETTICQGVVPVHIRTGEREKNDRDVVDEVQLRDVYRLKKLVEAGFEPKRIMDIGAHIGTFTMLAAHYWPLSWIYAFEPELASFQLLAMNLPDNATAIRAPVLGFYGRHPGLEVYQSHGDEQRWRLEKNGRGMSAVMACWIAMEAATEKRPLDMLKIDCEQSEVSILRELDMAGILKDIAVVHGEWHFETAKNEVKRILGKSHHVELVDEGEWNMFFASKT